MEYRTEKDVMGEVKVPADSYYGVFTARARDNFKISGIKPHKEFLIALTLVKKAAAITNMALGQLDKDLGGAIVKAADEVILGKFNEYFILDVYSAGAGTPFNMNCNEIIANRATELLGGRLGQYLVNPNNHVNMAQSTNDVIPTAARIACLMSIGNLFSELYAFEKSLKSKGNEFKDIVKVGRTHFEDAVPITLGQEFESYANSINSDINRIKNAVEELKQLGIGGTAAGTGINTHPHYHKTIIGTLRKLTNIHFETSNDLLEKTQNYNYFASFSCSLKLLSISMARIANNLSLLNMGPKAGISEIILPEVEPGSSIMPGKVNPSVPECVIQSCSDVIGKDKTIELGSNYGILELNVMCPIIAYNLLQMIKILTNVLKMFRVHCIDGIKADEKRCNELLNSSTAVATALNPYIGYQVTSVAVVESLKEKKSIKEIIKGYEIMSEDELNEILSAEKMTKPRIPDNGLINKIQNSGNYKKLIEKYYGKS
jgi:aspartate ammonia-lyase